MGFGHKLHGRYPTSLGPIVAGLYIYYDDSDCSAKGNGVEDEEMSKSRSTAAVQDNVRAFPFLFFFLVLLLKSIRSYALLVDEDSRIGFTTTPRQWS